MTKLVDLTRSEIYALCIKHKASHQAFMRMIREDFDTTIEDALEILSHRKYNGSRVTDQLLQIYALCIKYELQYDSMALRFRKHRSLAQLEDDMAAIYGRRQELKKIAKTAPVNSIRYQRERNRTAPNVTNRPSKRKKATATAQKWLSIKI